MNVTDGDGPECHGGPMCLHYFATAFCLRQAIQFAPAASFDEYNKLRLIDELFMSMSEDMRRHAALIFSPLLISALPEPRNPWGEPEGYRQYF